MITTLGQFLRPALAAPATAAPPPNAAQATAAPLDVAVLQRKHRHFIGAGTKLALGGLALGTATAVALLTLPGLGETATTALQTLVGGGLGATLVGAGVALTHHHQLRSITPPNEDADYARHLNWIGRGMTTGMVGVVGLAASALPLCWDNVPAAIIASSVSLAVAVGGFVFSAIGESKAQAHLGRMQDHIFQDQLALIDHQRALLHAGAHVKANPHPIGSTSTLTTSSSSSDPFNSLLTPHVGLNSAGDMTLGNGMINIDLKTDTIGVGIGNTTFNNGNVGFQI